MKVFLRILLPVALILFAASSLIADRSGAQPDPGVRYVDLQRCFEAYGPANSEMTRIREELAGEVEGFKVREKTLREREGELALMEPTSPEAIKLAYEIDSERMVIERQKAFIADSVDKRRLELFLRAYAQVKEAAARIGAQKGYGAVLVIPPREEQLSENLKNRVDALQRAAVLWTNPNYDVSDEVIAELNR